MIIKCTEENNFIPIKTKDNKIKISTTSFVVVQSCYPYTKNSIIVNVGISIAEGIFNYCKITINKKLEIKYLEDDVNLFYDFQMVINKHKRLIYNLVYSLLNEDEKEKFGLTLI